MALHFDRAEFNRRRVALNAALEARGLDAILLFAQESMYWLTGYDTFGFCFFQSMLVTRDDRLALLTRSADLRQAQHTSIVDDIRIWEDRADAGPADQLKDLLAEFALRGVRIGVEYDTQGLTARNGKALDTALWGFAETVDASDIVPALRVVKSAAEIAHVREAARIGDLAYTRALDAIGPGADEGRILAVLQGTIFEAGGDFPANEVIIGSGRDALLCRYKAGRRVLDANDQLTLEFSGVYRHYHAPLMRTVVIGAPTDRHLELFDAAAEALAAVEAELRPGRTFGDVFAAHARVLDGRGLSAHRLNACGYSVGARFTPSWMDRQMFYRDNPEPVLPGMTLFAHMILMDSESGTAMTLGRTSLVTETGPEVLSSLPLTLSVRA
ncbi:M24 family metallopeptidase [Chthonobacter rhizosphaerae]|uniref:M24 family metallopeptidase n=1 Tax=Chthonobacter rhizosphaerae TaxID=2735553 RepID=UPI0015EFB7D3|nr:Xaa-Pro peptidase family protein [Chthonobacter rhizosphaerae]